MTQQKLQPFNIRIMDVDGFIKDKDIKEVSSPFIKDHVTGVFDQDGLFSESIFGEIGSPNRLANFGFISLNTTLMNPLIFSTISKIKALYSEIMSGRSYAIFDEKKKDFVKVSNMEAGAKTGYKFFLAHCKDIEFTLSDSVQKMNIVKLLVDSKDRWFIKRCIVVPAGIRDYMEKDGIGEYDDVNKIYKRIIEISATLSGSSTNSEIFDTIRFVLQRAVNEVFEYLFVMMEEFMQERYSSRSVARATRNAIASADISSDEDNPKASLKPDEVYIPLYQAMSMFDPLVKNKLRTIFFNHSFNVESNQAALIDPNDFSLKYVEVSNLEKAKYMKSDNMDKLMNIFRDEDLRHYPFTVVGVDKKAYYLLLKVDINNTIYLGRSFHELKRVLEEKGIVTELTIDQVFPMSYYEIFYVATELAVEGKHTTVTRYPVLHHLGIYPAKVHVITTTNSNKKKISTISSVDGVTPFREFGRWPESGSSSMGGASPHPCQLVNLNADFDGDQVNNIGIMSDEANDEIAAYLDSPSFILGPNGTPIMAINTAISAITLFNLTKDY
jgi:hypothetical protein